MPNRGNRKDAIALLKEDHKKVKGLLAKLEKTTERSGDQRQKLLAQLEQEIQMHTTIEEEIFYPAYRDAVTKKQDAKLYQEAIEEHHVADVVLTEIKGVDAQSEEFSAKGKVLKELIEHHASEEEKSMFPKARKAMDAAQLKELGAQIQARKGELQSEGEGWIPSPKELLSALSAKSGMDKMMGGGGRSRSRSVAATGSGESGSTGKSGSKGGTGGRSRKSATSGKSARSGRSTSPRSASVAAKGASPKSSSRGKNAKSGSSAAKNKSKTSRSRSSSKSGRGHR
ncbi:MAG TPA: hemerythrin domain-containing protein [Candidatus Limnocylindrales bacterium]|nr:hemerythrin domain-containing protein [Candidatus Limnocylindrales bacterium]